MNAAWRRRVEEAVREVEHLNRAIEYSAIGLFDPEAATGGAPGEPSALDVHFVLDRIREYRYHRDQLETRLIAAIRDFQPEPSTR